MIADAMRSLRRPPSGLTLVELLVVLVILAVVTAIAVQSTESVIDQGRYDATQRTLQNVQDAIIGAAGRRESDGTPLVTGFVADLGRLPNALSVVNPLTGLAELQPQELWSNPNGLAAFALQPTTDPQVAVGCGWRGPYLRLPLGTNRVADGWGHSFTLLQSDGATPVSAGAQIPQYAWPGPPAGTGSAYNLPSSVALINAPSGIDQVDASLTGNVYTLSSSGSTTSPSPTNPDLTTGDVYLRLFGPDPSSGSLLITTTRWSITAPAGTSKVTYPNSSYPKVTGSEITTTVNLAAGYSASTTALTYSFTTTIGPRVLRAYQGSAPTWTKISPVTRLTVQAGGQTKDFTMQ